MAAKFEAFRNRGKGDVLGSHDLEDIIDVVDGGSELISEIAVAEPALRQYLAAQCRALLGTRGFMDVLSGMIQSVRNACRPGTVAEVTSGSNRNNVGMTVSHMLWNVAGRSLCLAA